MATRIKVDEKSVYPKSIFFWESDMKMQLFYLFALVLFISCNDTRQGSQSAFQNNSVKDKVYIYEVSYMGEVKHYEVFEHKENNQYNCISYPTSKSFGLWAFTASNLTKAISIKNDLLKKIELRSK